MEALTLLGAGDVLRVSGEPDLAKQRLQQGIAVAMEHKCLPVLLNLLISVAHTCMELRHFEDAKATRIRHEGRGGCDEPLCLRRPFRVEGRRAGRAGQSVRGDGGI